MGSNGRFRFIHTVLSTALSTTLVVAVVSGCALVADLGDRQLGDITSGDAANSSGGQGDSSSPNDTGGSSGSVDSGSVLGDGGVDAGAITGFAFHRVVTLTSDATGGLANQSTLIVLPSSFPYANLKSNGEDLRFSTVINHTDDMPFFIERWTPGGESLVWVRVSTIPVGSSTFHMFYGKPGMTDQSSFGNTFPNAKRTGGGGAGSFTATGDIDVDWFELKAGDTLTLASGVPLKISARRIIVAGTIDGDGRGSAGGVVGVAAGKGSGTGGGNASVNGAEGAGGGGYGGAGGRGGEDIAGAGGIGGAANGDALNDTIAMGSGGGATDVRAGGAGGGSLTLLGWKTTVSGTIRMNGLDGESQNLRQGGGGSGGGLLIGSGFLDLAGATLRANGGQGGICNEQLNDGGGGGGGGRIKLRRRPNGSLIPAPTMTVAFGAGGAGSNTTAPGENGVVGTTNVNNDSTFLRGIETKLGNEEPAP